ncbi:MAG: hypothetical protein PHP23_14725 [Desulfobacterales bacterium]|nr:hypothetical protein [Desulfobacterales bacterium]MDD4072818.1 hypothetical protein [Desulfobacterales bacterium]MDD4391704.1 hypothetical protein [Desulfobacterales bacterium]
MSTILKALKKLENETPQPVEKAYIFKNFNARQAIGSRTGHSNLLKATTIIALCGIILTAMIWFSIRKASILNEKKTALSAFLPSTITTVTPQKAKPHTEATSLPHQIQNNGQPFSPLVSETSKAAEGVSSVSVPNPQTEVSETISGSPSYDPVKRVTPTDNNDTIPDISPRFSPESESAVTPGTVVTNAEKSKNPIEIIAEKSTEETGIKIEAIAWSEDPGQRIAVINGHIVREGTAVNGFYIHRIGMEEVIFKEGQALWKIIFRTY